MPSITVVIKHPGDPAQIREIEKGLEPLQKIVGGYIEQLPFPDTDIHVAVIGKVHTLSFPDVCIICNEEARLQDPPLPINIITPEFGGGSILGSLIVLKMDNEGQFTSLEPDRASKIAEVLDLRNA